MQKRKIKYREEVSDGIKTECCVSINHLIRDFKNIFFYILLMGKVTGFSAKTFARNVLEIKSR